MTTMKNAISDHAGVYRTALIAGRDDAPVRSLRRRMPLELSTHASMPPDDPVQGHKGEHLHCHSPQGKGGPMIHY